MGATVRLFDDVVDDDDTRASPQLAARFLDERSCSS
jgi:hypothetical protein